MSSSQTAVSKGKNASSVDMKAQCDQQSKECLIHACVEELGGAAYRTGTVLTKVGWVNVVKKFNQRMGETGLGKDPDTGTIAASDDWWDLKLMRHPDCAKFRYKPLPLEDEMRILFGSNTATGEHKYTPSSGFLPAAPGVRVTPNIDPENVDALLEDDDEIQELVHPTESLKKRHANNLVGKKTIAKGKKGSATSRLEACLQQIVDLTDSASSPSVQRSVDIPTLKEAVDALNELPKFKDDSDL
ncbi:hypothetical protein Vadar_033792 [Vaccinium darrowii]|uniref:Uncharacterized protein n=1 Tax=Vaccinium darrowii TaxID=229202 RepID=A0ACB7ZPG6_9ERIC|nr:hypothetical protein Vadar_033792 [Vaccinium darrowii]